LYDPSGVSQQGRNDALAFHPLRAEGHFLWPLWLTITFFITDLRLCGGGRSFVWLARNIRLETSN
jgi:hypothetical protein